MDQDTSFIRADKDRETRDKSLDATLKTNDSLTYEDLPPEAFELLDDVEQGKHERNLDWILKERGIDSETLLTWKQCAPYRNALARARTSAIDKPEQSRAYAKGNALRVMRTIVDRARDSKAKDSQRAGETVLEIAGVITKQVNVMIPVQVQNVSLMLAQYQQVEAKPKDTDASS